MESHQVEYSKSSSEGNTVRSDQSNVDTGTGRFYQCEFCKGGFTTAQALGGHMNIHRKDRAKNNRTSTSVPIVSNKGYVDDDNKYNLSHLSLGSSYSYPKTQSYKPHYYIAPHELIPVTYHTFFPDSGWGFRPQHAHHSDDQSFVDNSQHMNPFGEEEDWPTSLSLGIGPSHVYQNKKAYGKSQEDDKLDLELRLGHRP